MEPLLTQGRGIALPTAIGPKHRDRATKALLTTKEVATLTGLSASYFEKGRLYGYGPKFIRLQATGKTGKILYRLQAVEEWLAAQEREPEVFSHGR
ncbi:MAG: hypothetical protein HLUCCA12_12275 [Rhodobacteraceae bacterium HLUCCA12]|nr:MAG: hypothetical protein HLUCCA12_12275 [Rhodobacteraceae bacterium HLUCCA12]